MSAFIVSDTHINTIVTWAVQQHLPLFIKDKWVYAHEEENAQMFGRAGGEDSVGDRVADEQGFTNNQ